jgi:SAM-dependent methyltransferase
VKVPEHVQKNRVKWDVLAEHSVAAGERAWKHDSPCWGIWGTPESKLHLLPEDMTGIDAIELGCGTAYVSSWLARRGARVVGIDNSAVLATARRLQGENGLEFPLVHGNAEDVPYPDASFDFAISEYGACLWADPDLWVPEAARLSRPNGRLVFLTNSFLHTLCADERDGYPAQEVLQRSAFGMREVRWGNDPGVEFHLSHADWIRLLRGSGFEIEDLLELRPEVKATTYDHVTIDWARKWPCEEVWKARKRGR